MAAIGNSPTQQAFTPAIDYFSGNGSTTAFTLSRPVASVAQVQVTIDNVAQNPSSAYTVSANTITFTSAPLSGTNNIYVYYTSPITQVIAPGQGTVTATSMASSTGSGAVVLATSPTLVTPTLGAASATSITVAAGAVGTPSITTAGDTNTGIFFPAADTIAFSEGGAESMRIDSSGNVGIGATPNSKLYVRAATNANLRVTDSSGTLNLSAENDAGSAQVAMKFNGSQMMLDASGNLLVGTTSQLSGSTSKLVVDYATGDFVAGFRNSNASPLGLYVFHSTDVNGGGSPFVYCVGGLNVRASIRSNGGIANFSANNVNLSDQREKKDIALASNYLDKICQIPVKTFLFNDQTDTDLNLGAIAQDVQAVCPELVHESNWAGADQPEKMRLSIYQTDLQYALMKSIQELKAINDTQAETINALTARIVALENR